MSSGANGPNKEAAKYKGRKEKTNTILTLAIGGALAGLGASFLFLSGFGSGASPSPLFPAWDSTASRRPFSSAART